MLPRRSVWRRLGSKRTVMPDKNERGEALRTSSDLPFEQRVDTEAALKDSIRGLRDTPLPLKIAASIPDTSTLDTTAAQISNMRPKMSNAVLSTMEQTEPITPQSASPIVQPQQVSVGITVNRPADSAPTPEPQATLETAPMNPGATVNTPPGAVAGTAPH
jgi:hypothetical protein